MTSRGNERRALYRDDRDRRSFLGLLAGLPERFGTRLHAYVLMTNHYHLVLETPEANLSRAMQWLNLTYTVGFNTRHPRRGHLFEGRYKSILIEDEAGVQEVVRYVHLNPVRVGALKLGKPDRAAEAARIAAAPAAALVRERIAALRGYRWSSYRAYAGYERVPDWLYAGLVETLCGGRTVAERQRALRSYTEEAVRAGMPEGLWERLAGGVVLGSESFATRMLAAARKNEREQPAARGSGPRIPWESVVEVVEKEKGERWEAFRDRYGDWGRDVALWLGRTAARMRLAELAREVDVDYAAVGAAVSRVGSRMAADDEFGRLVHRLRKQLLNIEI